MTEPPPTVPMVTAINDQVPDDFRTVRIHKGAAKVLMGCKAQLSRLALEHGVDSETYRNALESLLTCLLTVLPRTGFGGEVTLYCDDFAADLSLYGIEERLHFGINYSRQSNTWSLNS